MHSALPACSQCNSWLESNILSPHYSIHIALSMGCTAGRGDSGGNFTDYIEFQHSDDSGTESEELLHHANGNSSSRPLNLPAAEDWTWGRLLKDIWKVGNRKCQPSVGVLAAHFINNSHQLGCGPAIRMSFTGVCCISSWCQHGLGLQRDGDAIMQVVCCTYPSSHIKGFQAAAAAAAAAGGGLILFIH
jgi:hypothetical protein